MLYLFPGERNEAVKKKVPVQSRKSRIVRFRKVTIGWKIQGHAESVENFYSKNAKSVMILHPLIEVLKEGIFPLVLLRAPENMDCGLNCATIMALRENSSIISMKDLIRRENAVR